jgi:hypothetical protein
VKQSAITAAYEFSGIVTIAALFVAYWVITP